MRRPKGAWLVLLCLNLALLGCSEDVRPLEVESNLTVAKAELYPIVLAPAPAPHGVTADGSPIPCGTCHTTREPNRSNRSAEDLDEFHQGLTYAHGDLSCVSCHDPDGYENLRLADGTRVSYDTPMKLCAQCHGPQFRDYQNGAHGGWNGYWDRRRGPRTRNQCTHCHDPHAPAYPQMQPTFKPRDRFLESESAHAHEAEEGPSR